MPIRLQSLVSMGPPAFRWIFSLLLLFLLMLGASGHTSGKSNPKTATQNATQHRPEASRVMSPASAGSILKQADQAYAQGDYSTALSLYHRAASGGNLAAWRKVASMHSLGKGTPRNYAKSAGAIRPLADRGDGEAQSYLGALYLAGGFGLRQSDEEAFQWFLKAATNGNADGQYMSGLLYLYGRGSVPNLSKSRYWLESAAKQGHPQAIAALRKIQLALLNSSSSPAETEVEEEEMEEPIEEEIAQEDTPLPEADYYNDSAETTPETPESDDVNGYYWLQEEPNDSD